MIINFLKQKDGAATLIAAIFVTTTMLSISLSLSLISVNMKNSLNSFIDATHTFYAAETGVQEALMQLKKEPNNYIFDNFLINGVEVERQFIENFCEGASCISLIEATASTTQSTRKVRYSCTKDMSNCTWSELIP
ncbi:MAG: hypothetical protein WCS88_01200 [Patescibacteria group bacterium]|jgi:hypothetical protein